jgi:hypothetical protein
LQAEKDRFYLARMKGEKEERVLSKRKVIQDVNAQGARVKERIETLHNEIKGRKEALQAAKENRKTREEYLEESERNLERNKEMHKKTMAGLSSRRKELIADMFSIFPIDQVCEVLLYQQFGVAMHVTQATVGLWRSTALPYTRSALTKLCICWI